MERIKRFLFLMVTSAWLMVPAIVSSATGCDHAAPVEGSGNTSQAVVGSPCRDACDCELGLFCSIGPGATLGACTVDQFAPAPVDPCYGTCQCPGGQRCINNQCQAGPFPITPVSGSWWDSTRSGQGYAVSADLNGNLDVTWYTFTAGGAPIWFFGVLTPTAGVYTGLLYSSQFDLRSGGTSATQRGQLTLATQSSTTGRFSWVLDGAAGSEAVQYLVFGGRGSAPRLTGEWRIWDEGRYAPITHPARLFLDVQGDTVVANLALYDANGLATWVYGSAAVTSPLLFHVDLLRVTGRNLCPNCQGTPSTSYQKVGTVGVGGINAGHDAATITLSVPASMTQWNGTAPISRLTQ